jgi:DNA invertase Pin-like site-specific DNA recombinase
MPDEVRPQNRALEAGEAKALVAAKLDRFSRSMLDFAALMATAQKQSWALVALDCAVDTSTPAGEAMAHVLATFGQFERRLIGQRTKEALAAMKANGVRLGRPATVPKSVVRRIQRQRACGDSLRTIADSLNADGVPTGQGGAQWYAATVRGILARTA